MKILFLDVDGVLNSVRSAVALGGYPHPNRDEQDSELVRGEERFDLVAVGLIRKLCQETGANIVLSSTWRHSYPSVTAVREFGKQIGLPIIDKTPIKLTSSRGEEISMWLREHPGFRGNYAIVDDDSDMLEEQLPYFVKTSNLEGLSYQNYLDLLKILK